MAHSQQRRSITDARINLGPPQPGRHAHPEAPPLRLTERAVAASRAMDTWEGLARRALTHDEVSEVSLGVPALLYTLARLDCGTVSPRLPSP